MAKNPAFDAGAFKAHEKRSWEEAADNYEKAFGRTTAQAIDPLLDAVSAGSGVRLLDVCCGIGKLADAAAQRGATPVGLDFAASMVAQARRLHPGLDVREGDAEELPFEDASFDVVWTQHVQMNIAPTNRGSTTKSHAFCGRAGGSHSTTF